MPNKKDTKHGVSSSELLTFFPLNIFSFLFFANFVKIGEISSLKERGMAFTL